MKRDRIAVEDGPNSRRRRTVADEEGQELTKRTVADEEGPLSRMKKDWS